MSSIKQQCNGKTAKGKQCSRCALEGEIYCKTHLKIQDSKKNKGGERVIKEVIYHTHAPSEKIYPDCPRCNLKQTGPFSLSFSSLAITS